MPRNNGGKSGATPARGIRDAAAFNFLALFAPK
jgi:hypothetical protein